MKRPEEYQFLSKPPRLCRDGQLAIDDRQPSGCCSKNRNRRHLATPCPKSITYRHFDSFNFLTIRDPVRNPCLIRS